MSMDSLEMIFPFNLLKLNNQAPLPSLKSFFYCPQPQPELLSTWVHHFHISPIRLKIPMREHQPLFQNMEKLGIGATNERSIYYWLQLSRLLNLLHPVFVLYKITQIQESPW